jgi:hypothetical protein
MSHSDCCTSRLSLTERRRRVLELRSQNRLVWQIAQELGVTQRTVYRDIDWLASRRIEELDKEIVEHRRRELDLLYSVNEEAWKAWDKSKEAYEKEQASSEQRESANGTTTRSKVQTTRETTPGDPRFLQLILEASDKRAKLLGLYDLKEEEPKRPQYNEQAVKQALASLTDEQLEAVCTFHERVAASSEDRPTHAAGAHFGSGRTTGKCPPGPGADGGPDPFGPDPIPLCDVGRLSAGLDPVDLPSAEP